MQDFIFRNVRHSYISCPCGLIFIFLSSEIVFSNSSCMTRINDYKGSSLKQCNFHELIGMSPKSSTSSNLTPAALTLGHYFLNFIYTIICRVVFQISNRNFPPSVCIPKEISFVAASFTVCNVGFFFLFNKSYNSDGNKQANSSFSHNATCMHIGLLTNPYM